MPMDITEFLERDTLEISILDMNNIPSNLIDSSQTINTAPAPINTTPAPIKTSQCNTCKCQMSQHVKEFMQSLNKKKAYHLTITSSGSSAQEIDKNHCFVCRDKCTSRGWHNNPWIGCDHEAVCNSWARMKCIGWDHLVGEDVDHLPYLCPKCASKWARHADSQVQFS